MRMPFFQDSIDVIYSPELWKRGLERECESIAVTVAVAVAARTEGRVPRRRGAGLRARLLLRSFFLFISLEKLLALDLAESLKSPERLDDVLPAWSVIHPVITQESELHQ